MNGKGNTMSVKPVHHAATPVTYSNTALSTTIFGEADAQGLQTSTTADASIDLVNLPTLSYTIGSLTLKSFSTSLPGTLAATSVHSTISTQGADLIIAVTNTTLGNGTMSHGVWSSDTSTTIYFALDVGSIALANGPIEIDINTTNTTNRVPKISGNHAFADATSNIHSASVPNTFLQANTDTLTTVETGLSSSLVNASAQSIINNAITSVTGTTSNYLATDPSTVALEKQAVNILHGIAHSCSSDACLAATIEAALLPKHLLA